MTAHGHDHPCDRPLDSPHDRPPPTAQSSQVTKDTTREDGDRTVKFDVSAMPPDLSSYLQLNNGSTCTRLAEMKVTWTTQWRPPERASPAEGRTDVSAGGQFVSCRLQGSVNYRAGQWVRRAEKVHFILVMNESPPLAALLVSRGDRLPDDRASKAPSLAHTMHLGRAYEDFPAQLTNAHFERWVHEFSIENNFVIICILRVDRPAE